MIATSSSLADWQQLLLLSNQMLIMARTQQWEALIDGELNYIQHVNALSASNVNAADSPFPGRVRDILRQLLENEAEVKRLLLERMDELKVLIHQGNQQQSVNLAYGRLAGMLLLPASNPDTDPVATSEL
ncbi:flagellar protein FliT [Klebsiella sp. BIGb0407]|uniref:flagellar protein FliT n=1 Tax=Klebsiella sp. BIGb0407 TaxID=2940603 RepID=UPI002168EE4F|nr:flagellar protein FliT [Klebsiella sp. BIGb0407]MCS3431507.1 flagellar protein FliT [Klebsiella sp. BIGb0407]